MVKILAAHPNGVYVLVEPHPPTAMVFGDTPIEAGPASLAKPLVLKAALRARAKVAIKKGQALMDEARKLGHTDPEAAKSRYTRAETHFDTADAIIPNFARY